MEAIINAVYDGKVFKPKEKIKLAPNSRVILKLKSVSKKDHPLRKILKISEKMNISDLSENHDKYTHKKISEND
jgi:predicted DNA-binding antitoxin AbrB/MazE fold protein